MTDLLLQVGALVALFLVFPTLVALVVVAAGLEDRRR